MAKGKMSVISRVVKIHLKEQRNWSCEQCDQVALLKILNGGDICNQPSILF